MNKLLKIITVVVALIILGAYTYHFFPNQTRRPVPNKIVKNATPPPPHDVNVTIQVLFGNSNYTLKLELNRTTYDTAELYSPQYPTLEFLEQIILEKENLATQFYGNFVILNVEAFNSYGFKQNYSTTINILTLTFLSIAYNYHQLTIPTPNELNITFSSPLNGSKNEFWQNVKLGGIQILQNADLIGLGIQGIQDIMNYVDNPEDLAPPAMLLFHVLEGATSVKKSYNNSDYLKVADVLESYKVVDNNNFTSPEALYGLSGLNNSTYDTFMEKLLSIVMPFSSNNYDLTILLQTLMYLLKDSASLGIKGALDYAQSGLDGTYLDFTFSGEITELVADFLSIDFPISLALAIIHVITKPLESYATALKFELNIEQILYPTLMEKLNSTINSFKFFNKRLNTNEISSIAYFSLVNQGFIALWYYANHQNYIQNRQVSTQDSLKINELANSIQVESAEISFLRTISTKYVMGMR